MDMFCSRRSQPNFSIDAQLANRQSLLSIVPEIDSPATFVDRPEYRSFSKPRPISEVTEIFEEIEDDLSEFEEDSEALSFESNERRRSQTTISSYDEVHTPQSGRRSNYFTHEIRKSVEGPRGPHLFRASFSSDLSFDYALQLSPMFPKQQELKLDTSFLPDTTPTTIMEAPMLAVSSIPSWNSPPENPVSDSPRSWKASEVSYWMATAGIDATTVDRFEFHDISGMVLMDLEFHDLKELGIESFGKRHEVWSLICTLREGSGRPSPAPTPFEDARQRNSRPKTSGNGNPCDDTPITPGAVRRRRRKYRRNGNEPITPADSVSIVAIEQLIPKPHKCEKGENCSKWKKQQRLLRRLHEEHGLPISPEHGGHIFMTGDPGNAFRAPRLLQHVRPASEAEPSVVGPSIVASSDLLGPGELPPIALNPNVLEQVEERDAQENVKQFLNFQHIDPPQMVYPPSSPIDGISQEPLEMFPSLRVPPSTSLPSATLQTLPRLQIPRSNTANGYMNLYSANRSAIERIADPLSSLSPCHTATPSGNALYRFGTPASEMDVPLTAIPTGPISRHTSQSVPPNMHYREPIERAQSRPQSHRRPSFQLPILTENEVFTASKDNSNIRRSTHTLSPSIEQTHSTKHTSLDVVAQEVTNNDESSSRSVVQTRYPGVNHAGWMKKRKTKILHHEWTDSHFRLSGNTLAMHRNDIQQSAILETLNIDEYAVGCSSIASRKLSAKFRALGISMAGSKDREKEKSGNGGSGSGGSDCAFEFQLVPTTSSSGLNASSSSFTSSSSHHQQHHHQQQQHGKPKTHHFAVKSKDERIDWMRELMLCKALKAKRDGFDVEVNGGSLK